MKIHGLCLVKNEADVLQQTFMSALHWCDQIYVFDNGSIDGTWELVNELAKHYPQIVPYRQDDVTYSDGLLADFFNAFRSNAGPRDWWCRLDADEFYIDDPRIFLAKIADTFRIIWAAVFTYYFTDRDAISYEQDPVKYLGTPVEQRLRYYQNDWGVPKFFRHSDDIMWTHGDGWPEALSRAPAYPVRIWMKHYQYRSPEQIERRLLTRRPVIESFRHEALPNWGSVIATARNAPVDYEAARPEFAAVRWEERIVPAASLNYDGFDRRYVVNESLMSQIQAPARRSHLRAMIPDPIRTPLGQLRRQAQLFLKRLGPGQQW
jgi:glycosyltransferase involved in cell wall biosynthesis